MSERTPPPLSPAELRARRSRVARVAKRLGFVGRVEYRHVYSRSGGAQYGLARAPAEDLLTVYAEAFERDADPEDFSLEAMIAHERGHQLLARHPRLAKFVLARLSEVSEEVVASLLGAILLPAGADQRDLLGKATFELLLGGRSAEAARQLIEQLLNLLEALL